MNIDTNTIVPITVANQNFIIYEFNQADTMQAAADEDVLASSAKLMRRNEHVYEELAE